MERTDSLDRRTILYLAGIGAVGALAGCLEEEEDRPGPTGDDQGDAEAEPQGGEDAAGAVEVGMGGDNIFDPEIVDIEVGETLVWEWASDGHTVTPESIPDDSDWEGVETPEDEGHTHRHTFEVAGEYEYVCTEHRDDGMEGRVNVADESGPADQDSPDPESGAAEADENESEEEEGEGEGEAGGTYDERSARG